MDDYDLDVDSRLSRLLDELASITEPGGLDREELVERLDKVACLFRIVPWPVRAVEALPGLRLAMRFDDGLEGVLQLKADELTGVLEPLRNESYFRRVQAIDGVPTWPDGQDIAPDAAYADIKASLRVTQMAKDDPDVVR